MFLSICCIFQPTVPIIFVLHVLPCKTSVIEPWIFLSTKKYTTLNSNDHVRFALLAFRVVQLQSHFYDVKILGSILLVHNLLQSSFVTDTSRVDILNIVIKFVCFCLNSFWNMSLIMKNAKESKKSIMIKTNHPLTCWQTTCAYVWKNLIIDGACG